MVHTENKDNTEHAFEQSLNRLDGLNIMNIAIPVPPAKACTDAPELLRSLSEYHLLPVVDTSNRLINVIRDVDLLRFGPKVLLKHQDEQPTLIAVDKNTTVEEVRVLFESHEMKDSLVPIIDREGIYSGYCACRREFLRLLSGGAFRPPRMGGLATPLGVYITSGVYSGGPGWQGLVLTGVVFSLMVFTARWLYFVTSSWVLALFPTLVPLLTNSSDGLFLVLIEYVFTMVTILALLRVTPMAGYHAAEHMTINTVERGMKLVPDSVSLNSRIHNRCGTNLMALLGSIQLSMLSLEVMRPYLNFGGEFLYMFLCIILISRYWRRMGTWLQWNFTTKPPTEKQLLSGISAGQAVLKQFSESPHSDPGFLKRFWKSGLIQIILGFWVGMKILEFISEQGFLYLN